VHLSAAERGHAIPQSLKNEDAENIGYVIPPPVIHHFLDDFARNGKYTGFPGLGVEWQKMESPYLQKSMGMKVLPGDAPMRLQLFMLKPAVDAAPAWSTALWVLAVQLVLSICHDDQRRASCSS